MFFGDFMPEGNSKLTSNKKEYNATRHEKAGAKHPAAKSVKSAAPTTPCGKFKAVEQAAPTTPCGNRTNGKTRYRKMANATEKEGYDPNKNSDGTKDGHTTKTSNNEKDGHANKENNTESEHATKENNGGTKVGHAPEKNGDAASRVFYCFILSSFIFALVVIPTRVIFDEVYRASTEYRLILFQLTAGLVFLRLPRLLSKPLGIDIPHGLYIAYMLFLWAAIFLGEFALLYYRVPFWDTLMHFFSAVLLTLLGLSLPTLITGEEISPLLCTILAVGFSVTVGVLWEVYEFSFDGILGLNMQKFATLTRSGLASLTGRAALTDTMTDLIVDLIGSLVPSVAAGIYIRKNGRLPPALTVSRCK